MSTNIWTVHKRSEEDGAGRVEQVEISVMVDVDRTELKSERQGLQDSMV